MTTADIMFAQPGNRTIDHESNARAVLWALLAAIFIHLVIAFLLALFGGVFSAAAQPTLQPAPISAAEQFAILTARPTPAVKPSTAAASAYRPYKDRTRISGRITNRGVSSVNALGTPLGRYMKFLLDAVGSRW